MKLKEGINTEGSRQSVRQWVKWWISHSSHSFQII